MRFRLLLAVLAAMLIFAAPAYAGSVGPTPHSLGMLISTAPTVIRGLAGRCHCNGALSAYQWDETAM